MDGGGKREREEKAESREGGARWIRDSSALISEESAPLLVFHDTRGSRDPPAPRWRFSFLELESVTRPPLVASKKASLLPNEL